MTSGLDLPLDLLPPTTSLEPLLRLLAVLPRSCLEDLLRSCEGFLLSAVVFSFCSAAPDAVAFGPLAADRFLFFVRAGDVSSASFLDDLARRLRPFSDRR
ncbi:MAG: hypothetical protein CMJ62_07265 [Planctomycetaceae bacterium]|nr:hypothetical protein [Planctomycetaceae bacterium]